MKNSKFFRVKQQFGNVVSFKRDYVYGTVDAPVTGDLTVDLNDAGLCVTSQVLHNDAAMPNVPAICELRGGGSYVPSQNNILSFEYFSPTKIYFTIL